MPTSVLQQIAGREISRREIFSRAREFFRDSSRSRLVNVPSLYEVSHVYVKVMIHWNWMLIVTLIVGANWNEFSNNLLNLIFRMLCYAASTECCDWISTQTSSISFSNTHCDVTVVACCIVGVFRDTFRSLSHTEPEVLHPVPDCCTTTVAHTSEHHSVIPDDTRWVFLSINRYERKKNIELALDAVGLYHCQCTVLC